LFRFLREASPLAAFCKKLNLFLKEASPLAASLGKRHLWRLDELVPFLREDAGPPEGREEASPLALSEGSEGRFF